MRKILQWILFFFILSVAGVIGVNRLINALIHSKTDRIVPNLIGKNINNALDMLSPLNLYLKKSNDEFHPDVPAGLIISQVPPSGSVIKEGKAVKVIVSAGREVIFVPDLTNQTVRSAQLILRKNTLDLGEHGERYSMIIEEDKIITQTPRPRTPIQKNGLVNIVVSLGLPPEGVTLMPDFMGRDISEAKEWAILNDVTIKNINRVKDSSYTENTVIKQVPENDLVVDESQEIEFWIAVDESSEN
ncbi:MAG: PASTA domain-containing protein [Elusimicrobia bacterium]|nr:PASTA domain-containing protein [Elusimicrobiota bacterium]